MYTYSYAAGFLQQVDEPSAEHGGLSQAGQVRKFPENRAVHIRIRIHFPSWIRI